MPNIGDGNSRNNRFNTGYNNYVPKTAVVNNRVSPFKAMQRTL